jgi:O-antigen/teichoic acid export membrane protein
MTHGDVNPKRERVLATEIASGARWSLSGQVGTITVGIGVYMLVTRLLTPADAGRYFTLVSLVALTALVAQLGQAVLVTREIAQSVSDGLDPSSILWRAIFRGTVVACLIGALVGAAVVLIAPEGSFSQSEAILLIALAALWSAAMTAEALVAAGHRGLGRIRDASWTQRFGALTLIFGALAVVAVGDMHISLFALAIVSFLSTLVVVVAASVSFRNATRKFEWRADSSGHDGRLVGSASMFIATVMGYSIRNIGLWILAMSGVPEQAALYGVAQRIALPVLLPLTVVNGFIGPIAATMWKRRSLSDLERALRASATMATIASIAAVLAVAIVGPALLTFGFGEFYRAAYPIAIAIAIGSFGSVALGSPGLVLTMTGHERRYAFITAVSAAATALIALVGYSIAGPVGLALAVSMSTIVRFGITAEAVRRQVGIRTVPYLSVSSARRAFRDLRSSPTVTAHWNVGNDPHTRA